MKYQPLVSIGIPTYNRSMILEKTIIKFLYQTYKNIEIIVSDNCSDDRTKEICMKLAKKDKRIKYYNQSRKISAIANFNFTLSKAKGEFFMTASDDDYWDKKYIQTIMKEYLNAPKNVLLISTKFQVLDRFETIQKKQQRSFSNYKKKYIGFFDFLKEGFGGFKTGVFYGIHRTKQFKEIGGYLEYPALSAPDFLTLHKLLTNGKLRIINKTLFFKRENIVFGGKSRSLLSTINLAISRLLVNLYLPNLIYLLKNVLAYHNFNWSLIKNSDLNNKIKLYYYALISDIQLFLAISPNDIQKLKNRNKIFSSMKILKKFNLE